MVHDPSWAPCPYPQVWLDPPGTHPSHLRNGGKPGALGDFQAALEATLRTDGLNLGTSVPDLFCDCGWTNVILHHSSHYLRRFTRFCEFQVVYDSEPKLSLLPST